MRVSEIIGKFVDQETADMIEKELFRQGFVIVPREPSDEIAREVIREIMIPDEMTLGKAKRIASAVSNPPKTKEELDRLL